MYWPIKLVSIEEIVSLYLVYMRAANAIDIYRFHGRVTLAKNSLLTSDDYVVCSILLQLAVLSTTG